MTMIMTMVLVYNNRARTHLVSAPLKPPSNHRPRVGKRKPSGRGPVPRYTTYQPSNQPFIHSFAYFYSLLPTTVNINECMINDIWLLMFGWLVPSYIWKKC
jgi:hypothetical protein